MGQQPRERASGYRYKWEFRDKRYYNIEFVWNGEKGSIRDNANVVKEFKVYDDKDYVKPNNIYE